ncbi:MAG: hypothetical protein E6J90_28975 [Deltaproteobacteria bacterium]|nr:MAG: hypothetical protein E6J90_28975 [Deltaproteobacteria bacterium]
MRFLPISHFSVVSASAAASARSAPPAAAAPCSISEASDACSPRVGAVASVGTDAVCSAPPLWSASATTSPSTSARPNRLVGSRWQARTTISSICVLRPSTISLGRGPPRSSGRPTSAS